MTISNIPISPLRQRFIEGMTLRKLAPRPDYRMAFNDIETARLKKEVGAYVETKRPARTQRMCRQMELVGSHLGIDEKAALLGGFLR